MTTITSSRDGAVATVTIDKAALGNLLTVEDLRELAAAIRAAGATDAKVMCCVPQGPTSAAAARPARHHHPLR
jgi:enoyl-CoA hydratase/carnithine racemase